LKDLFQVEDVEELGINQVDVEDPGISFEIRELHGSMI
jgi:hypothetical protein